ncbi:hypothetical protein DFJ73DRAFT_836282, partial [Zopfochytrium polystomum]
TVVGSPLPGSAVVAGGFTCTVPVVMLGPTAAVKVAVVVSPLLVMMVGTKLWALLVPKVVLLLALSAEVEDWSAAAAQVMTKPSCEASPRRAVTMARKPVPMIINFFGDLALRA